MSFIPRIRAVLFDCDGTLLDNIPLHRSIHKRLCWLRNIDPPIFYYQQLKKLGYKISDLIRYLEEFAKLEIFHKAKLFPRTIEMLIELQARNIISGIVTNRPVFPNYFEMLTRAGVPLWAFDFFVNYQPKYLDRFCRNRLKNCHLVRWQKPDLRCLTPVENILKALPDYPRSVLIVGDSLKWEWELARNGEFVFAGVCSGVTTKEEWLKAVPENRIIDHVGELLKII